MHFARNESQRFGGGVSLVSTQHDLRLLATCVRPYSDNTPRELIGSLCVCQLREAKWSVRVASENPCMRTDGASLLCSASDTYIPYAYRLPLAVRI